MTERPDPFAEFSLEQLRTRTSAKWRHYPADVLPLWVAEMDLGIAPVIADALVALVRNGDTGYPGDTPYLEAFAAYADSTWGWDPLVSRCRAVESVIAGYSDTIVDATDPGSTVVVTSPVYPPFYSYLRQANRVVTAAPLSPDLRLDMARLTVAFAEASARGNAAFLLCNPHNPGGTVHTREE